MNRKLIIATAVLIPVVSAVTYKLGYRAGKASEIIERMKDEAVMFTQDNPATSTL